MAIKPMLIMGVVILALGGIIAFQQIRVERVTTERDQAIQYSLAKGDTLIQLKTKNGQISSRSTVLELTIRNLERLQADKDLKWLHEIEGLKKSLRNVEQISTTTARAVASFKIPLRDTTILHLDSLYAVKAFDNKNEWIRERGLIFPDTVITNPEVYVPLQSVMYWERKKKTFLNLKIGRKEWFKQTTSPNPYVRITKDELIRVSKRKPK